MAQVRRHITVSSSRVRLKTELYLLGRSMDLKNILLVLFFIPALSFAERQDVTGDVGDIRYHVSEGTLAPHWNEGVWFQLINTDKTLCVNGLVSIEPGNETAISMLLAAKMADKQVLVTVDSEVQYPAGSYCRLQYLTIK